jgi:hypothetical protein
MVLTECFSSLKDPRRPEGRRIDLDQLLSMVTLSYLCGYTGYRPVAKFSKLYSEELSAALKLRHRVPSHVTFREVLMNLDQSALIAAFNNWASIYTMPEAGNWVSGDGKALNSTVNDCHGRAQDFQAVVSIFSHKSGLVNAIEQYQNKTKGEGEANVMRFLLERLEGMGLTITLDALHTQKKR